MKIKDSKKSQPLRLGLVTGLFFASALMVALISAVVNKHAEHYVEMVTESTQNHLMAAAQAAAALISAGELDRYHTAEDTDTEEYWNIKEQLTQFAEDYHVLYAYYWRGYAEDVLQYIVDNDTDPETQVGPESFYPIEEIARNALAGNVGSTDLGIYTPTWGGLITGYAPVYDSGGNFYCVAGVDISDEFIFIQRRNSRNMTILQIITLSVSVIFGVLNMLLYRRQAKSARDANAAKTRFLSQLSHEIRTPLNAVIGFSGIELRNKLPASSRENIMHIHQSGTYLLGIINEILDISKIESGNIELVCSEYETAPLISRAINLNRVRIGSKPIAFVLEIGGDFPRKLRGDELRVEQILNNLLSNAVKYTREGTISLAAVWERIPAGESGQGDKALLRFAVRDTGIGIRQEDMGKLFTSYTQLDTEANRKIEGTGLGLTIAQRLSRIMGGRITVESEYGKGSVFTAEIIQSLADGEPIGEDAALKLRNFHFAAEEKEAEIVYTWMPEKKALAVDDKPVNLLVVREMLKPYGLRVDTASSGLEAITMVKTENYDIVFMDHMMDEMDGVEAAGIIREWERTESGETAGGKNGGRQKRLPIVALTASALQGMKEFYLEHGFDDYLSKPVNSKEMDEVLKKWIGRNGEEWGLGIRDWGTGAKLESADDCQHAPITNNDPTIHPTLQPPTPFSFEMEALRLDKLKHFCAAFESGREIDKEYYRQFTALIESLEEYHSPLNNDPPSYSLLIEAAQRGDAQKIRENLPAFYEALKKRQEAREKGREDEILAALLPRLKKAVQDGETETAKKIIAELAAAPLGPDGRELYFKLYDLQFSGEIEKAPDLIEKILTKR